MTLFLPHLISWLQEFSYPALWLMVFIASVGAPLPISLVLLASGAFAALGDFNLVLLTITATSASVCGDSLGYFIGRCWGSKVLDWIEQSHMRYLISPQNVARSREYFKRRGGPAVFLSRFLFSALGAIINLVAGADPYPYHRFLLYDAVGEILGSLIPLILGYVFGASWEAMGDLLGTFSAFVLTLIVVLLLTVRLIKMGRVRRAKEPMLGQIPETLQPASVECIVLDQATATSSISQLPP